MGNSGNGAPKSALGAQPSCRLPLQLTLSCAEWAGCPKLGPVGEGTARDAAYMGFGGMRAARQDRVTRLRIWLRPSPTTRRAGAEFEFWNAAAELRATQSCYDQPPGTHRRQLPGPSGTRTTVQQDSRICCKPPPIARTHRKLAEPAGLLIALGKATCSSVGHLPQARGSGTNPKPFGFDAQSAELLARVGGRTRPRTTAPSCPGAGRN